MFNQSKVKNLHIIFIDEVYVNLWSHSGLVWLVSIHGLHLYQRPMVLLVLALCSFIGKVGLDVNLGATVELQYEVPCKYFYLITNLYGHVWVLIAVNFHFSLAMRITKFTKYKLSSTSTPRLVHCCQQKYSWSIQLRLPHQVGLVTIIHQ